MADPKPPDIPPEVMQDLIKQMMEGTGTFSGDGGAPPDLTGLTIDFSKMHNLDHSIWRCKGYGGRRHHWRLWWRLRGHDRLRANTLCRMGHHDLMTMWKMREGVVLARRAQCRSCDWFGREVPM